MSQALTWTSWRQMILAWWGAVAAFLMLITLASLGMEHRNHYGHPHQPDYYGYTFQLISYFSILPVSYFVCSRIPFLRQHYIVQWLLLMPVYVVMVCIYALAAIHNSSAAYLLLFWIFILSGIFHLIFAPLIWSKLN